MLNSSSEITSDPNVARKVFITKRWSLNGSTPQKMRLWPQVEKPVTLNERPDASHIISLSSHSPTTGTEYIMYHKFMTRLHCSFYCFIGPFIVHVFGRDVSLPVSFSTLPQLPLSLNPLPFAIDVHLSIFACVWAYFGKTSVTRQKRGLCEKSCFAIGSSCCCWDTSEEMENWTHTHPIYH